MLVQDIIRRKRDGQPMSTAEIEFFVRGLTDGSISEGQVSALAMAIYFRDLNLDENVALTRAMLNSGTTLQWQSLALNGPVLDKHSSGGVGDKVSLMLAPMLAACGAYVPMVSGRGLGHTGGTLDKLDSIPGYNSVPGNERLQEVVAQVGCAIVGQTETLAPADRRFYAIRDVTGTVEALALITASILSKKLSAGLDGLVMDIKTGSGAFADTLEKAQDLGGRIVKVGTGLGLPIAAVITDMSQVLGTTAGNSVEVRETLDYLTGKSREARLHDNVLALGEDLLVLSKLAPNAEAARKQLQDSLDSGRATEIFARMVRTLGGPGDLVENTDAYLEKAPVVVPVYADQAGYLATMDTRSVGNAVVELGGGRRRVEDRIDPAVGLTDVAHLGQAVGPDAPIAWVHARDKAAADAAGARIRAAVTLSESPVDSGSVILQRIG
ncbi:thymidine phosphorylase [Simiduia aestuariiviva]|uniref:Thymidine phosphorylase n=1 Tax=Simiduia aestuariiviva TaxID=1510459 RepID=A0A839UST7_9GAMM|nr:thymidine phosphorylase [Simiduia aestuariiviva]MBB3169499.1 thymidine phosphorylase [Simiduia aestuariiviva]